MRISDWSSDVCSSDLSRLDLSKLVPMGGTTEEFSFDQKRNLAGRRRNRGRHLRSGISGFVIGDHCSFGRRAPTDFQRCGSCILVEAQTQNPRHLRERRQSTSLWQTSSPLILFKSKELPVG